MASNPPHHMPQLRTIRLKSRHPVVSIHDLGLMLEIDITVMNDRNTFYNRLYTALHDAYRQGLQDALSRKN